MDQVLGIESIERNDKLLHRLKSCQLMHLFEHYVNKGENHTDNHAAVDESDRLPNRLRITKCDLLCYCFSIFTYVMDVLLDIAVAYMHFRNHRFFAGILISIFIVLPSLFINAIAAVWWTDDEFIKFSNDSSQGVHIERATEVQFCESTQPLGLKKAKFTYWIRIVACIFQLGPILFYVEVIRFANIFRKMAKTKTNNSEALKYYCYMAEAERDASLLRMLEAFLESIPQLLVQGYFVTDTFSSIYSSHSKITPAQSAELQSWVRFQIISIVFSLLSASWSIVGQHRSLRVASPLKNNMDYCDSLLQVFENFYHLLGGTDNYLCSPDKRIVPTYFSLMNLYIFQLFWRLSVIMSRYISMLMLMMTFTNYFPLFLLIHFLISFTHISILQRITFNSFPFLDSILLFINAIIHLFTPFNMVEGPSRLKYLVAFSIEFIENAVITFLWLQDDSLLFPYKFYIALCSFSLFFLGIVLMLYYYSFYHPNIRELLLAFNTTGQFPTSTIIQKISTNGIALSPLDDADEAHATK